jgi:hypothetical protein
MSVQLTESTVPVSVWFTSSYSSGGGGRRPDHLSSTFVTPVGASRTGGWAATSCTVLAGPDGGGEWFFLVLFHLVQAMRSDPVERYADGVGGTFRARDQLRAAVPLCAHDVLPRLGPRLCGLGAAAAGRLALVQAPRMAPPVPGSPLTHRSHAAGC